jgi:hypothetical protein
MKDTELILEEIYRLLEKYNVLEIKNNWKENHVVHGSECFEHYGIKSLKSFEKFNHLDYSGIYAYALDNLWLYIGTGRSIKKRIVMHLKESCKIAGGKTWQEFFSIKEYSGRLSLYTLQIGQNTIADDNLRIAIEVILQKKYPTEWDKFLEKKRKQKEIEPKPEE